MFPVFHLICKRVFIALVFNHLIRIKFAGLHTGCEQADQRFVQIILCHQSLLNGLQDVYIINIPAVNIRSGFYCKCSRFHRIYRAVHTLRLPLMVSVNIIDRAAV